MVRLIAFLLPLAFFLSPQASAQTEAPSAGFRRANESAARSQWDEAIQEYARLDQDGVRSPSLYWNWAQTASASGKKGEALWATLRALELSPKDSSLHRELERLRGELGLDPSEISLGFIGDVRLIARRFRFDLLAALFFLLSIAPLALKKRQPHLTRGLFVAGVLFLLPFLAGPWRDPRGVVVQKDAPLVDIPRDDAVALANLREGEVVPLLAEEGEYVRIQDASGARGFAHRADIRKVERP